MKSSTFARYLPLTLALPAVFYLAACALGPRMGLRPRIRALIVDGQNNHKDWPETSKQMKRQLEETGLFDVEIVSTPPAGGDMQTFHPDFKHHDVVISNYNGEAWPESTQQAFEAFVRDGGGFVSVHAANNAFPEWLAYNQMIGLGGWGSRDQKAGPYVYLNDAGEVVRDETTPGRGGSHGPQHEFAIQNREPKHPIMRGLPGKWLHARDELYDSLRGPAQYMTILATAYSDPAHKGTSRHEPMVLAIEYGKGRVVNLTPGHSAAAQRSVDFITLLRHSAEWAATGNVSQKLPRNFPTEEKTSVVEYVDPPQLTGPK